jgi:dTDP-glucose pyrophosphorylase
MKAVIMAGGMGSRLQPLTIGCPKPMVDFVDKPVLVHILDLLKRHNFVQVIITSHYMADYIKNYIGDGSRMGMKIQYAVEEAPLGTAGSVKNAEVYLDDEAFLVISGDAITDIDLSGMLLFHREKKALATLALKHVSNPHEYGVVVTDNEGRVRDYSEKPNPEYVQSHTVNTGIYVLEPEVLALMEPNRRYDFSIDIFPLILKQNALFGYFSNGYWRDIGTMPSYLRATADALSGKISLVNPEAITRARFEIDNHLCRRKEKGQPLMSFLRNRRVFSIYWIILALAVLACDYAMGPFIQFPFLFVIPVMLASWFSGRGWGFLLAFTLPLVRWYFAALWAVPWPMFDASINALIRVMVLLLLAYLIDRTASQTRALTSEIQILKGLLPICSFCKKIRSEDNRWEQLEWYITRHSEAQFSHGVCPDCAQEHYGEFLKE